MSLLKGGPKWKVIQRFPQAHALMQQGTGHWKVVTGDRSTGKWVIGEGEYAVSAWRDAVKKEKL